MTMEEIVHLDRNLFPGPAFQASLNFPWKVLFLSSFSIFYMTNHSSEF